MALAILDSDYEPFSSESLKSFHNGHLGGAHEQLIYIRNSDPSKYYTNIQLEPVFTGGYEDNGEFGTSGWGIKMIYGRRRPTEDEWDRVGPGSTLEIADIGTSEAADTFTNHPVWVRIYCPAGENAQIRENMSLSLSYFQKEVTG